MARHTTSHPRRHYRGVHPPWHKRSSSSGQIRIDTSAGRASCLKSFYAPALCRRPTASCHPSSHAIPVHALGQGLRERSSIHTHARTAYMSRKFALPARRVRALPADRVFLLMSQWTTAHRCVVLSHSRWRVRWRAPIPRGACGRSDVCQR